MVDIGTGIGIGDAGLVGGTSLDNASRSFFILTLPNTSLLL